jgi:hypothetical protein
MSGAPSDERSGLSFVLVTWTASVEFSKFAAGLPLLWTKSKLKSQGKTALTLLSGRYQVMPSEQTAGETIVPLLTPQAYNLHVTVLIVNLNIHSLEVV